MKTLPQLRTEIDEIDWKIIELLCRRFEVCQRVGQLKQCEGTPLLRPDRWQKVLDSRCQQAQQHGLPRWLITAIYQKIHEHSLNLQAT